MKTYLNYWKKHVLTGNLVESPGYGNGLCNVKINGRRLDGHRLFKLFVPQSNEPTCSAYWGAEVLYDTDENRKISANGFTAMRQNIILLMAAMNGEL